MKRIRSLMTLAGFSLALVAFGAAGARAQVLTTTNLVGTFTLPFAAQWGAVTLPAGDYTLRYGVAPGGTAVVEVQGTAKGSPHGFILAQSHDRTSAAKNAIVCIHAGKGGIVRGLDLPAIGESAEFALPQGIKLMANQRDNRTYAQLGDTPELIQRLSIKLNGK
jgi:hypothetical protein